MNYQDVLNYWYSKPLDYHKWFTNGHEYDDEIRYKFSDLLLAAENGYLLDWLSTKDSYLALIILLDQFSRHIYRGTKYAYQNDKLTILLVEAGLHYLHKMNAQEKIFIVVPYQHSEDLEVQKDGLQLLTNLIKLEDNIVEKNILKKIYFHQLKHYEVIKKFGRFPKRNYILGRESTEEEIDYIDENTEYDY